MNKYIWNQHGFGYVLRLLSCFQRLYLLPESPGPVCPQSVFDQGPSKSLLLAQRLPWEDQLERRFSEDVLLPLW